MTSIYYSNSSGFFDSGGRKVNLNELKGPSECKSDEIEEPLINHIYGLFIQAEDDIPILSSISVSKTDIENIIPTYFTPDEISYLKITIEPLDLYIISRIKNPGEIFKRVFKLVGTSNDLLINKLDKFKISNYENKLYAFNSDESQKIIILDTDYSFGSESFKDFYDYVSAQIFHDENISLEPVKLNTFYPEGVINGL